MNWHKIQKRFDSQSEELKRLKPFLFDVMTGEEKEQLHKESLNMPRQSEVIKQAKLRLKEKRRLRNDSKQN